MVFTGDQKIKIVEFWYETQSYVAVRRRFCRDFNLKTRDGPKNGEILRFVKHFKQKGTVHSTHKGRSGRPATVTKNQANIEMVRISAIRCPKTSHRRAAARKNCASHRLVCIVL